MKKTAVMVLGLTISLGSLFAETLSLEGFLKMVEENSKDLYLSRNSREQAASQAKLARSAALPMIQGTAGYTRNFLEVEQPFPAYATGPVPGPGGSSIYPLKTVDVNMVKNNDFSFGLGLQQNLFDLKVFEAIKAAKKYESLTGTIHEASRQAVLTAAKKLFYQTMLLEEAWKVKKTTEELSRENYEETRKKLDNGVASELELLQAKVQWETAIPGTTQAARNRDLAMNNLKHMAGIDPETGLILDGSLLSIPKMPEPVEMGKILGSRPDYQSLQQQKELNDLNIKASRCEFYPSLKASASFGWKKSDDDFNFEEGTMVLNAGLSLSIPLFLGGSRFAKLEKARLEKEKTEITILKKQDEIRREIHNLQLMLDEAASRIVSAESTLATAEKAYAIMEVSSASGLATQLDLKDTLLSLDGARLNYYNAIYDYLSAWFSWQQATGEGDELLP